MILDEASKQMIWRVHGQEDRVVDGSAFHALLKARAATVSEKENAQLSALTLLIHVGEGVQWEWFSAVVIECAKLGVWRIETVVQPRK